MKKLLAVMLVGSGLLLLAGCVPCDEMCSVDDHAHKSPSKGLHRKNMRDEHSHKPAPVAQPKRVKMKKVKHVKARKPVKVKRPKVKKAKKMNRNVKRQAYHREEESLREAAAWADEKELVDAQVA